MALDTIYLNQYNSKKLIYIYEIKCINPTVNETYIGQTNDFDSRKSAHIHDSINSQLKLYQTIRKYGGWENWNMKMINKYYCKSEDEARQIEQKYIDFFNPSLNSINSYVNENINKDLDRQLDIELYNYDNKLLGYFLYDFYDCYDCYENNIIINIKCSFCDKNFKSKSSLTYHQKTAKFCLKIQGKNHSDFICKSCDKIFQQKQHLENHNKICKKKIINNEVDSYEEKIKLLEKYLEEKDKLIEEKDKIIEKNLKEKDKIIEEKDKIIKDKNKLLIEKDNIIHSLRGENKIYEKDHHTFTRILQNEY